MEREQILALAEKADETATQYLQCAGEYHPDYHSVRDEHFYHAAIESYKAELLKEAGEPVLYAEFAEDGGWLGDASEYADHLEEPHALFTSDQVAAAIAKATKPLEEEIERLTEWEQAVVCECMACDACLDCSDPRKTVKNIREYYFTWGMEEQKTILETGLILELRARIVTMDLGGVVERALALPCDTSALDAYVSEKMKEAVSTQKEYYESVFHSRQYDFASSMFLNVR